jgi:hypothetical protein
MALSLLMVAAACPAQRAEMSDAEYIKLAVSAAPQAIGEGAGVARIEKDGSMRSVRAGNNGFTCMIMGGEKMCNDANAMEFMHAVVTHSAPPDKMGFPTCYRATTWAGAILIPLPPPKPQTITGSSPARTS